MTINKLSQNNKLADHTTDVLQLFPDSVEIPTMPLIETSSYDDNFSMDDIVSVDLSDATSSGDIAEDTPVENVSIEDSDGYQALCNAINEENNSIALYTNLIYMMSDKSSPIGNHPEMVPVLKDIMAEEHKHIGQLQALQKILNANTKFIDIGEKEADEQIGDVLHPAINQTPIQATQGAFNKLQVTTIDPINKNADSNMRVDNGIDICSGDDFCSVANVDDSF